MPQRTRARDVLYAYDRARTGGDCMVNVQGLNVVIDLSHFNAVTSFTDVKNAGVVGIHKATQGTD